MAEPCGGAVCGGAAAGQDVLLATELHVPGPPVSEPVAPSCQSPAAEDST